MLYRFASNWIISPRIRVKMKNTWNHHRETSVWTQKKQISSEKEWQKPESYPLFSGWKTSIIMVDLIPVQVVFIHQTKQERLKRTLECQKHTHWDLSWIQESYFLEHQGRQDVKTNHSHHIHILALISVLTLPSPLFHLSKNQTHPAVQVRAARFKN